MEQDARYKFVAAGKDFHSGYGVGGPCEACDIARRSARATPGVEHRVLHRNGSLLASYKLVDGRMKVVMP